MKAVICGGKNFNDWDKALRSLDYWRSRLDITVVVHDGDVSFDPAERALPDSQRRKWGVAALAQRWAELRGVGIIEERVRDDEWKKLGDRAAPLRNRRMLDIHKPGALICFPGDDSAAEMLNQARAAGVKCIEVV